MTTQHTSQTPPPCCHRMAAALQTLRPLLGLLTALTLWGLAPTNAAAQPRIEPAPLRIMLIGDSITEGDAGGYRVPLFRKLSDTVGMPNFVGHRNSRLSDPADMPDTDHDGYAAYRIEQIAEGTGFWNAPPIEARLRDWDPAVVTIHAGTNDAQQNYLFDGDAERDIGSAIQRLSRLVGRIVAYNPAIQVVVAQIIPANAPASDTTIRYVERLNAQIPGMVAAHRASGHRVSMVDLYTPMRAHPNPDGIHPSAEGAQVMADELFKALKALGVLPVNPDPGRDDGLHQVDNWSRVSSTPGRLGPNLIRAGSSTLQRAQASGYAGRADVALLNDGRLDQVTDDNLFDVRYTLNTARHSQGYDVYEILSHAGQVISPDGDERAHQAYEVWWSSVEAPEVYTRLGDFHHIMVNREERASQMQLTRLDGQPLMRRVKKIEFRMVEPPLRQVGFFGITNPTRYRELEVRGVPVR